MERPSPFPPVFGGVFSDRLRPAIVSDCSILSADLNITRVQLSEIRHKIFGSAALPLRKENGAYGIRTRDLLNAIEALYQLS
jgi:hypothetical protein